MKVYVGWDSTSEVAYDVCKYSILKHSKSTNVYSLKQEALRDLKIYTRDADPLSSTEFTFTRFLVPYLCDYTGWAVFCDNDFLWLDDISQLLVESDPRYAVHVVKHNYTPSQSKKMDDKVQYNYPRKNWSSLILWNCSHPSNRLVTPSLVNNETGQYLHRFMWLDDSEIGELHHQWNWLTDWYEEPKDGNPKALHFTMGGPWLNNYRDVKYANTWNNCFEEYNNSRDVTKLIRE